MKEKTEALALIKERLITVKDELGLKTYVATPVKPISKEEQPAVVVNIGQDIIVKRPSNGLLYPVHREGAVGIDIVLPVDSSYIDGTIQSNYRTMREAVLSDPHLSNGTYISEASTEGPTAYDTFDVIAMRLNIIIQYTDDGE